MVDALQTALARSSSVINTAQSTALRSKAVDLSAGSSSGFSQLSNFRDNSANRQRYGLFRGTLYAAINAIASEAAGQELAVGRIKGKGSGDVQATKAALRSMPQVIRTKASQQEIEILYDHPFLDLLAQPNPIQGQWQFVYSFVANLLLTGWAYIVGGENEDGELEFYSLPTTWVRPDHKDGPFSRFKIQNPNDVSSSADDDEWLTRENVAFAHLPNPANPMGAYAPAQAQISSIRIDDHIQACQEQFFANGIFPSVIVTIGKDPHPDVPGGMRPRLSGVQRRQVTGAIRKAMGGVQNYGNPAIVDGLIESIEKLSMTQNEMGWDKSEDKVKSRILSVFSVHPYMLGEPVGVGGEAQVVNIEKVFYKKVNTYMSMLSSIMTNFAAPIMTAPKKAVAKKKQARYMVWWEPSVPVNTQQRWGNLNAARTRGDVSKNEIRAELGLPPDETGGDRTHQFTSADLTAIATVAAQVMQGALLPEQAIDMYKVVFDVDEETASKWAGTATEQQVEEAVVGQATDELKRAMLSLGLLIESEKAISEKLYLESSNVN